MSFGVFDSTAQLIEVVGIWMAAIATFFAAFIALRIANRQDEIRLKVSASSGYVIGNGVKQEIAMIRVVNVARRTATVASVGWKFSRLNNFELYQTLQPPNPVPPISLDDGQLVSINFPIQTNGRNWYDQFSEVFSQWNAVRRFIEIRALRLQVVCTTGEEFLAAPSRHFLKHVRDAISRSKNEAK